MVNGALRPIAVEQLKPEAERLKIEHGCRFDTQSGQEGSLRRGCLLLPYPVDGVVRQIDIENVIRLADIGFNGLRALDKRRMPLVRVAADKTVEVVEPEPRWPQNAGR
jgi:hypothetical protein